MKPKLGRKSLITLALGALAMVGIHKRRTANGKPGVPQAIVTKGRQLTSRLPRPSRPATLRRRNPGDPGAVEFEDRRVTGANEDSES